jgi:hypothetical protein
MRLLRRHILCESGYLVYLVTKLCLVTHAHKLCLAWHEDKAARPPQALGKQSLHLVTKL